MSSGDVQPSRAGGGVVVYALRTGVLLGDVVECPLSRREVLAVFEVQVEAGDQSALGEGDGFGVAGCAAGEEEDAGFLEGGGGILRGRMPGGEVGGEEVGECEVLVEIRWCRNLCIEEEDVRRRDTRFGRCGGRGLEQVWFDEDPFRIDRLELSHDFVNFGEGGDGTDYSSCCCDAVAEDPVVNVIPAEETDAVEVSKTSCFETDGDSFDC